MFDSRIKINQFQSFTTAAEIKSPYYNIIMIDGASSFSVDFTQYVSTGRHLLFLAPYQCLNWHDSSTAFANVIQFHGDFYCIEYHKKEVACNGILFNNIYQQPFVAVSDLVYDEINTIIQKMQILGLSELNSDVSIVKSYLQLILALCSKEKLLNDTSFVKEPAKHDDILNFQSLLDKHFLESKEVEFYASKLFLSNDAFSKKIKKLFGKSPSKLIQERIVLEAKKLLHLTYKPIKIIASELNFEDEFYFSRYFKKGVGVSPKKFREDVGISIVAKQSM
jgi:AraC family transcriptional activator of pobA